MAYIARQRIYFVNLQRTSGVTGAGSGGKNIKKTTSTGTMDEYDDNASIGGKSIGSSTIASTVGKYAATHEIPTPKNINSRESAVSRGGFNETGVSRTLPFLLVVVIVPYPSSQLILLKI
jgi:hypothetical protein